MKNNNLKIILKLKHPSTLRCRGNSADSIDVNLVFFKQEKQTTRFLLLNMKYSRNEVFFSLAVLYACQSWGWSPKLQVFNGNIESRKNES